MNKQVQPIEYSNQRILTSQQLAEAYGTDTNNIYKNFQRNKDRYTESKHYFCLEGNSLEQFKSSLPDILSGSRAPILYLWTEKGALMHAKSLNTDKAWAAYEILVDEYYRLKNETAKSSVKRGRGRPKKPVETPVAVEVERIGNPPYFLSEPYPDLLAEEIAGFAENGDSSDLSDILQEYLLYMNEPLSLTQIRKECEAFQLMPVRILKIALQDCVDFGCIETVKKGNSTCYQIPEYLKPQSRALVVFKTKES